MCTSVLDRSKDVVHVSPADRRDSPNGVDCFYIRVGNSGLKCYRCEDIRDRAVSNQRRLAKYAPRVIAADVTVVVGDFEYYAYETEHIHTTCKTDAIRDSSDYYDAGADLYKVLKKEFGIDWFDNHSGNVGFNSEGDPVIIDCADKLFQD